MSRRKLLIFARLQSKIWSTQNKQYQVKAHLIDYRRVYVLFSESKRSQKYGCRKRKGEENAIKWMIIMRIFETHASSKPQFIHGKGVDLRTIVTKNF